MEASSIITQVSREDEHLKSFVPDKGKSISPGRASTVFGVPTYLHDVVITIIVVVVVVF